MILSHIHSISETLQLNVDSVVLATSRLPNENSIEPSEFSSMNQLEMLLPRKLEAIISRLKNRERNIIVMTSSTKIVWTEEEPLDSNF